MTSIKKGDEYWRCYWNDEHNGIEFSRYFVSSIQRPKHCKFRVVYLVLEIPTLTKVIDGKVKQSVSIADWQRERFTVNSNGSVSKFCTVSRTKVAAARKELANIRQDVKNKRPYFPNPELAIKKLQAYIKRYSTKKG